MVYHYINNLMCIPFFKTQISLIFHTIMTILIKKTYVLELQLIKKYNCYKKFKYEHNKQKIR